MTKPQGHAIKEAVNRAKTVTTNRRTLSELQRAWEDGDPAENEAHQARLREDMYRRREEKAA